MKRAQGALEYLIIIAAVIGIAAVVVYTLSGVMSSQSSSVSIASCKQAATNCKASKLLSPNDPCTTCESACKNQATGVEIFSGATLCCAAGESSKIYAGSLVCASLLPQINLVINTPVAGSWTGASALLTATTDVSATCYYGTAPNPTTQMSNTGGVSHGQPLTGLTEIGTTQYFVRCTAGASPEEKSVTWSVDTTPPTVSITSPSGGTVSGNVPISTSVSDSRSGVYSVKLYVNNQPPGVPTPIDYTSPYAWMWSTLSYAGNPVFLGTHTLKVEATDNVGISQFSSTVTVAVSNFCTIGSYTCDNTCTTCSPPVFCCHDSSLRYYCSLTSCPV